MSTHSLKLAAALLTVWPTCGVAAGWLGRQLAERYPRVLFYVETDAPVIALTIDDGPDPATTPRILDVLRAHDARATFFLIGERIRGNESIVRRIVEEGHELGNHFWRDQPSIELPEDELVRDLRRTHAALAALTDHPLLWFRPGSGLFDDAMLDAADRLGYTCVLGTIYPLDAHVASPWFSDRMIDWFAGSGSIVILHDGGNTGLRTADALSHSLPRLRSDGYRIVSVSELVAHDKAQWRRR